MQSTELEALAQDLAIDIQAGGFNELVITTEGKCESVSVQDFEALQAMLSKLAPGVNVSYRPTLGRDGRA